VRRVLLFALLLSVLSGVAAGQKRFAWVPDNTQSYRLEPAHWQAVMTFDRQPIHIRMGVEAAHPVSLGLVPLEDWKHAQENKQKLGSLPMTCAAQGVVHTTYTCDLETHTTDMVLVVRDQRSAVDAVGMAIAIGIRRAAERMASTNVVTFTMMRWACVEYCNGPAFAWVNLFKEKFKLTPIAKTYGPVTPDHDGAEIRFKMKAPMPMIVAVMPVVAADNLRANPAQADSLLAGVPCKQRAAQSATFSCKLNVKDGVQQIVLMPEPGASLKKKKMEVEIAMTRCIANCDEK
jgi:hypothetical protein